ncbi:MAG: LysM peptidoglycan-binding domain-containing protein [Eubacteriales bacterium]|nr:LysM peptidoglycan-binding domain-containing protein [Clostridiales bacterium]MDY5835712.1 LysM peptidoglycan-binding domain-containing protein [Eubacteriales bacterium]
MAKNSRYVGSRLATTVNARYYPDEKVIDAYYLDSRFTPNTESRAVRDKSNYEDRGFLFALFAYPAEEGRAVDQTSFANSVQKLNQEIKAGTTAIDSKINDLADCAIDVGGKATLAQEGVRQSYFAGLIVQEGEIAAVTTGAGCAFIYKGNVLYPLTAGEFELEPIDLNGNPVQHLNNYAAGVAGTIRYSNLAQIEADDCLILCNKEVLDILGQREMLRILAESDLQEEAAQNLITAAAAKQSGVSLQVMLSLVESVGEMSDQPAPRQQVPETPVAPGHPAPAPGPQTSHLMRHDAQNGHSAPVRQDTQIYSSQLVNQAMQNASPDQAYAYQAPQGQDQAYVPQGQAPYSDAYNAGASYAQEPVAGESYAQPYDQAGDQPVDYGNYSDQPYADQAYSDQAYDDQYGQESYDQAYSNEPYQQDYSADNYDQNYAASDYDQSYYNQDQDPYANSPEGYNYDQGQGQSDYGYDDQANYGYDQDQAYDQGQGYEDNYYDQDGYYDQNGQYPEYQDGYQDQYQDQYYDEYQQNYQDGGYDDYYENQDNEKVKRIIFYVVLAAIILVCVFILVRLLGGGKKTPTPTENPSVEATSEESTSDQSKPEASKPAESKSSEDSKPSASKDNSESQNNGEKETSENGEAAKPSDNTDAEPASPTQGGQANTGQGQTYTVKAGDTFFAILNSYYQSYDPSIQQLVLNANPDITNPDDIRLGQEIILPPAH